MINKTLLNPRRIFALISASAFLAPLLIMIIFVLNDFNKEKLPNDYPTLVNRTNVG